MKKTLYSLLTVYFFLCASTMLKAQEVECRRDFTIKTAITPSTCMANGTITVTLEGDLSELDMDRTEYALEPAPLTTGTSILPSTSNILSGIAPGTYKVTVRTFCKVGANVGHIKEILNVKVIGTYVPLMADFDQNRSRKSYGGGCATGIIAFNVTNNTGYGTLKFSFAQAPPGVPLGEFTPTKGTLAAGKIPYTLVGLYPPGDYRIDIDDNCGKSTITFTLGEVTGFPPNSTDGYSGAYTYTLSRPDSFGASCNKVQWKPYYYALSSTLYPDYYRYYVDGMYETALTPTGQTPVEADWKAWDAGTRIVDLPGQYNDYRKSNSLVAHLRVKGCNQQATTYTGNYIYNPTLSYTNYNQVTRYCDYYTYLINNSPTAYYGIWCYPVTVKVTNTTDNVVEYNQTFTESPISMPDVRGKYNKNYTISATGGDGITYTVATNYSNANPYITTNSPGYKCNTFTSSYYIYYGAYWNCYPVNVKVTKLKDGGNINNPADFELYETYTFTSTTNTTRSIEWPYGDYKFEATFQNYLINGTPYVQERSLSVKSTLPSAYNITANAINTCFEDQLALYVTTSDYSNYPAGTSFTVIEAPAGYTKLNVTSTNANSNYYYNLNSATWTPAGKYKVRVDYTCGNSVFVEANLNGGYSARNTSFKVERDGCRGDRLKIDGLVTYQGVANASYTNFQIISGPSGFDATAKAYNGSVLLTADGTYTIGVKTGLGNSCSLKTETINYVKTKPTLNPALSSAYICTGRDTAYIIVSGQGGQAPYSFVLLNQNKTPTGATPIAASGGRTYFNYGERDKTYLVRITDDCGNQNEQEIKVTDLETQRIVYSPKLEYCIGETIDLNCITLGQTTYQWTYPDGTTHSEQNPRIPLATPEMSGAYTVTVNPEFCGNTVDGTLLIKVYDAIAATGSNPDQDVCVASKLPTLSYAVTGGKGIHRYQWQKSTDNVNWNNIVGATSVTLEPSALTRSGVYYYRLQLSDDCNTVLSAVTKFNVKACYIMVNPTLRDKVQ